ncbi:hypothetical protein GCM10010954_26220 [Halobacillus andaensis]|uniref:Tetrapyrrole biosynthesis uroporphyrinogen III synthase domain-containing protein n=1 Tax=Halobacillus andaensis TaxID=1176239 RepID=A0A917EWP1_HALAA|nr:uroporphyrinogen-III synthase [Halobacillus andaensis]MBP2005793.1 uroporphyrinogen-III synthase [Halobacillus andaensis]GGF26032.1 hypothetical protein GCM10010954_26220 [Halobacillus andaensis]
MTKLTGKTIAIAADRQAESIEELIRKQGGTPITQSIQGQKVLNEKEAEEDVAKLIKSKFNYVILTTGIGARALEEAAERLGRQEEYIQALQETKLAIRGSKTVKWLKEKGLEPTIVSDDGTMNELVQELDQVNIEGDSFFLQQYNKNEPAILNKLNTLPINLYQSLPYHYIEPKKETVHHLKQLIFEQKVDAVVFTSKTQVQNLFQTLSEKLSSAFNQEVTAVAIGSVTADELRSHGITHVLEPDKPKMGAMIIALSRYYQQHA